MQQNRKAGQSGKRQSGNFYIFRLWFLRLWVAEMSPVFFCLRKSFSTMQSGVAPQTKSEVRGDWGRCTNKRKWHREDFVLTDGSTGKPGGKRKQYRRD